MVDTLLPYTQQDCYDRNRVMRSFKAVILENAHLKATFIPELGGRLWSLWDKLYRGDADHRSGRQDLRQLC